MQTLKTSFNCGGNYVNYNYSNFKSLGLTYPFRVDPSAPPPLLRIRGIPRADGDKIPPWGDLVRSAMRQRSAEKCPLMNSKSLDYTKLTAEGNPIPWPELSDGSHTET